MHQKKQYFYSIVLKIILFSILVIVVTACGGLISYLPSLHSTVNLNNRGLKELPESLWEDTTITKLSLFGNQLEDLPVNFSQFSQLETVYLGKNKFKQVPEVLCKLKNLKVLSLAYNELDSLPDCICQLEKLEWLILNNNQLIRLPDSLQQLKQLKQLNLKRNRLEKLPESFYELKNLQFLDVGYNELESFSTQLSNFTKMKEIRAYRAGNLFSIPESICSMRFLERLYIDNTAVVPTCVYARITDRLVVQFADL